MFIKPQRTEDFGTDPRRGPTLIEPLKPNPLIPVDAILEGKTKGEVEEAMKELEAGGAKCEMK